MKKVIGILLIGIMLLNIIGFLYVVFSNPVRLEDNAGHFMKKIFWSVALGALGIYLVNHSKNKIEKDK